VEGPQRVFLSHTAELRKFPPDRSFVTAASAAGDAITDMAYFPAREGEAAEYRRAQVRGCDVYVGMIGLRYGTPVHDEPEVSYTEPEFDTATRVRLPRRVLLLDEGAAVPIPPEWPIGSRLRVNKSSHIHQPRLGGTAGLRCAMVRPRAEGGPRSSWEPTAPGIGLRQATTN
jgi:Domain of unknown function (DUF4062)